MFELAANAATQMFRAVLERGEKLLAKHRHGPGRCTLDTLHRKIGASKQHTKRGYMKPNILKGFR